MNRRLKGLVLTLLLSAGSKAAIGQSSDVLSVYRTPLCGCCKTWEAHAEQQGLPLQSQVHEDISFIKAQQGIAPGYQSCHTAVSPQGFVFEGHVPAKFIKQFLAELPADAIGLTVPAMPLGSPGMEMGDRFTPYQVLLLLKDGQTQVYAKVTHYEEQF